ncbi:ANTAR domain-containing protein [Actinomycetospora straminea]|uniref:GAF and ANTAR domain-containing protein n=1 Tax=Actinomycetospora straminea TaxID=663607 RepID=A0ABP9ET35_9PSEU|nr:ANTAR domain-containing protein [Actinomycetospora straminea]MDD7934834.1 ANTAR domain-containing protein [Actinomycetospora straminea]
MTLDSTSDSGPIDGLAPAFVHLADALFAVPADSGVVGVVERVVDAARAIVPGADVVSVVLRNPDGRLDTVAASHDVAFKADALQDEVGEGPSHTAMHRSGVGTSMGHLTGADASWPTFGRQAAEGLGLGAVLSTGMFPGGEPPRFGALNFYSWTSDGLDAADRDHALVLAAHAATAIAAVQARTAAELREAQLREALKSRDVIGQAKGVLMERRGLTSDEAFDLLRRTSQDLNVKLREVAETLVTRRGEL